MDVWSNTVMRSPCPLHRWLLVPKENRSESVDVLRLDRDRSIYFVQHRTRMCCRNTESNASIEQFGCRKSDCDYCDAATKHFPIESSDSCWHIDQHGNHGRIFVSVDNETHVDQSLSKVARVIGQLTDTFLS